MTIDNIDSENKNLNNIYDIWYDTWTWVWNIRNEWFDSIRILRARIMTCILPKRMEGSEMWRMDEQWTAATAAQRERIERIY